MRLNEATTLYNSRLLLRPYRRWHVPTYHQWMESEALREQTASERLSREQEEEMQKSWRLDEDKLTFIVHLRSPSAPSPTSDPTGFLQAHNDSSTMLGDVNLFLHPISPPSSPSAETSSSSSPSSSHRAELEIMLPPSSPLYTPRSGLAFETLKLFISYATSRLNLEPQDFFVKIGDENEKSLRLFGKLGFEEIGRSEVFREVELGFKGERWEWETVGQGEEMGEVHDPRDEERD